MNGLRTRQCNQTHALIELIANTMCFRIHKVIRSESLNTQTLIQFGNPIFRIYNYRGLAPFSDLDADYT